MRWTILPIVFYVLFIGSPSRAQSTDTIEDTQRVQPAIPVFEGDIVRPYRIIGKIDDNLRKHFAFQTNPTKAKIYAEIWERGKKMGADAVIYAKFGPTVGTLFNHGRTPISGVAVKFTNVTK